MYADTVSDAMNTAINETNRRRKVQEEYNQEHGIVPKTIIKEIKDVISNDVEVDKKNKMSKKDQQKLMSQIEDEMKEAARNMDFERAMELRDILFEMKKY